ncbi:MAG: hypothetical protein IJC43_05935 [Clostridia bacterium]|nr:hypothetical protein [Clostridia bacterium]
MFDIYLGDLNLGGLLVTVTVFAVIPLQLLLCFKAKDPYLRLLPGAFCAVATSVLLVLSFSSSGWDGLGYLVLAAWAAAMMLACAVGWGIWIALRLWRRTGENLPSAAEPPTTGKSQSRPHRHS